MAIDRQLLSQWQENPRLRIGLALIIAILATNSLFMLDDYRKTLIQESQHQQTSLIKLRSLEQETGWAEKAESVKNIRLNYESKLWKAVSKGLAQANVQTWFNDKIKILNINGLQISGTSVDTDLQAPDLWRVKLELKGTLYDLDLLGLLNYIEQNPNLMVVDQLQWVRGQNNLLVISLQTSSYFYASEKNQ